MDKKHGIITIPSRWLRLGKGKQMSLYKRNGHWHFTKTIDGVRYRGAFKTARTRAQADEAYIEVLKEIHDGTYGKPKGTMILAQFVRDTFIPWTKSKKRSYRSDLSRLKPIVAFFGKMRFKEITSDRIEQYQSKRLRTPIVTKRKIKPRTPAAVNREVALLSRVFTLAIERKQARENPCSMIAPLEGEKRRKRRLSSDERVRLFDAIAAEPRRSHLAQIVALVLQTGLRKTELLSLRPEHVNLEAGVIHVMNTKNGDDREVVINRTARAILDLLIADARKAGAAYLFTNPRTQERIKDVKRAFNSACRKAGIENFHFHDLRHEFASRAGDDPSVTIPALAETLGHRDWRTTQIYTHASTRAKLRVVEAQEKADLENSGHKSVTNEVEVLKTGTD
jgi:integrase